MPNRVDETNKQVKKRGPNQDNANNENGDETF
jgi:hypothetical protein